MRRLLRLTILLPLLVVLLVAGLLPAAGSWSCPDGTACVYSHGRGFHCLGDECRMACCAGHRPAQGCGRCEHGAIPGLGLPSGNQQHTLAQPARCRYQDAQQVGPAWAPAHTAPDLQWHPVAALPMPAALPVVNHFWERLAPVRGSPLPSHLTPSLSPRAPPGPNCA